MLSYTRIKTFMECPKKYEYIYILERRPAPTQLMLEGQEEHLKIANEEQVPDFFKSAFKKYFSNPVWEEQIKTEFLTFDLQGKIDCYSINSFHASIADWKLFNVPETPDQLKTYCLLLLSKYQELEYFTCFYVSIKGEFYKRYVFTREEIEEYFNHLALTADIIHETKEFLPKPSQACAFCHFVKDCFKEHQITAEVFEIKSLEEAIELAKKVYIAEAFLKQVKELLKEYMFKEGLDEIVFDQENRLYLCPVISLRFGKINGRRKK